MKPYAKKTQTAKAKAAAKAKAVALAAKAEANKAARAEAKAAKAKDTAAKAEDTAAKAEAKAAKAKDPAATASVDEHPPEAYPFGGVEAKQMRKRARSQAYHDAEVKAIKAGGGYDKAKEDARGAAKAAVEKWLLG